MFKIEKGESTKTGYMKMNHLLAFLFLYAIHIPFFGQEYCVRGRFTDGFYFRSRDIQHKESFVVGRAPNVKGKLQVLDMDICHPGDSVDTMVMRPLIMLVQGGNGDKLPWKNTSRCLLKEVLQPLRSPAGRVRVVNSP